MNYTPYCVTLAVKRKDTLLQKRLNNTQKDPKVIVTERGKPVRIDITCTQVRNPATGESY